jgi:hypothetical protein
MKAAENGHASIVAYMVLKGKAKIDIASAVRTEIFHLDKTETMTFFFINSGGQQLCVGQQELGKLNL